MSEEMKAELNRRSFLVAAATATCGCALGCPFALGKADDDDDDDEDVPKVPMGPVDIGLLSDFAREGSYDKWIKDRHMIVVRDGGKLFALTAICSHKQSLLKILDNQVYCGRHKSRFNYQGKPVPKPSGVIGLAKKALGRFAIKVNEQNHVIVDTSKAIDAGSADDLNGFVKV
jgi:nitrite reductase/ring-hydroxylating ferredoxin subunit